MFLLAMASQDHKWRVRVQLCDEAESNTNNLLSRLGFHATKQETAAFSIIFQLQPSHNAET